MRVRSPKGTDVTMRIAGRPLDKDIGVVTADAVLTNLPAGEVCLAPLEDGADGRVVFDLAFWDGRRVEDLEVEFERGRAAPSAPRQGLEIFTGMLAAASGAADVIGELGIGLNPAVTEATGYMLTDEKILGTIHIAVGENTPAGRRQRVEPALGPPGHAREPRGRRCDHPRRRAAGGLKGRRGRPCGRPRRHEMRRESERTMSDRLSAGGQRRAIDLRSDTVTRPTPGHAPGDGGGRGRRRRARRRPTVIALEECAAELFGKEAALYVPSGTMGNQVGPLRAHRSAATRSSSNAQSHIFLYEQGGAAVHSGVQVRCFRGERRSAAPRRAAAGTCTTAVTTTSHRRASSRSRTRTTTRAGWYAARAAAAVARPRPARPAPAPRRRARLERSVSPRASRCPSSAAPATR